MSKIGIIRNAIVQAGGKSNITSYTDGPNSEGGKKGVVRIKVDKATDGLDEETRAKVAEELNEHPLVERAYISRAGRYGYDAICYGKITGQHLFVLFPSN